MILLPTVLEALCPMIVFLTKKAFVFRYQRTSINIWYIPMDCSLELKTTIMKQTVTKKRLKDRFLTTKHLSGYQFSS